jgi:hypothetical protein
MHTVYLSIPTAGRAAPLRQVAIQGTAAVPRDRRGRLLRALAGPANTTPFYRWPHNGPTDRSSAATSRRAR